ncbi:hypothetical protein QTH91_14265 [Variovorax dokdonensis]|uniref:Lipoprotein n=1 Tax=Variovorax dokdonensis TaxID=344883 RepID=A0ABT7NCK4_9BURK|nr:hypothetical protein [Variovorax dokdonensis]MDM0045654.1 hypothetical protein [Variovorax dokdonensis]
MKQSILNGAACAAVLMLAACGGSSNTPVASGGGGATTTEPAKPKVSTEDLSTGAYAVSTGDADKPTVGRYYAAADGKRLLAFEDADDSVDLLLRRADAASAWVAVPAPTTDLNVSLLSSQARTLATPDAATLAGRYVVRLSDGAAADFNIGADGRITAGTSACKLSGSLASSTLPGALSLSLTSNGCAALPASATGVLVVDALDAPASLRLIADDGARTVDLRAYVEAASAV